MVAAACAALLAFGYYLEFHLGLEPCPLCISQRFFFFLCAILAVAGAVLRPRRGARVGFAASIAASAAIGGALAGRQLWLQHLPAEQVPVCGPGLAYMLEVFPLSQVLAVLLKGDGHCAEVAWRFLGLSIPGWSLLAFAAIASAMLIFVLRGRKPD